MSLALLNRQPITWDNEAASYLTSVESVDSQSLELTVARAINTFVIDCKIRGIWGAIKSSCLLCGARTLSGALVPLKGVAPTSNNFVSADYNRETGLKGNGSNKYLNSNYNNNTDPQNSKHLAIYQTSLGNINSTTLIGALPSTGAGRSDLEQTGTTEPNINFYANSTNSIMSRSLVNIGFLGVSRSSSTNLNTRMNVSSQTNSITSQTPYNGNIFVFARNLDGNANQFSNPRLSFYSIGESLDLRLLEQCVNKFNLNLLYSLRYNSSDSDVQNYLSKVEAVDNYPLENSVRLAIHDFVAGCKSDNTWNSIKASCIMMGARTLNGALVPLVGNSPSNFNFLNSDYNRKTGLKGNASNKYLNSNRANNTDGQDNQHLSVYISSSSSILNAYIGAGGTGNGASNIGKSSANNGQPFARSRSTTGQTIGSAITTGFMGKSRSDSVSYVFRHPSEGDSTQIQSSQTPSSDNIYVFARNNGSNTPEIVTDARLAFYSIGSSLTLSLLDSRVTALYNSINSIF